MRSDKLQAAVVGIVYFAGYLRWSVAWFICPVILSVLRDQWRKKNERKRNLAKSIALSSEKEFVLARIDDLPSWVRNHFSSIKKWLIIRIAVVLHT